MKDLEVEVSLTGLKPSKTVVAAQLSLIAYADGESLYVAKEHVGYLAIDSQLCSSPIVEELRLDRERGLKRTRLAA